MIVKNIERARRDSTSISDMEESDIRPGMIPQEGNCTHGTYVNRVALSFKHALKHPKHLLCLLMHTHLSSKSHVCLSRVATAEAPHVQFTMFNCNVSKAVQGLVQVHKQNLCCNYIV